MKFSVILTQHHTYTVEVTEKDFGNLEEGTTLEDLDLDDIQEVVLSKVDKLFAADNPNQFYNYIENISRISDEQEEE